MCPDCGSLDLITELFDFGSCSQTGYQDAGERFRCLDCGAMGPVEDAEPAAPVRKPVKAAAAGEAAAIPASA